MEWLGWNREVERNRDVLERILALLLAFAGLADRASSLPAPVRLQVLGFLGLGEAEARNFVVGMAHEFGAPTEAAAVASAPADHADRLAASFRALAWVVGALLAQARRLARLLPREAGRQAGVPMPPRKPAGPKVFHRVASPFAPDTS
jgi:AcrR family transcriptional regulator